MNPRIASIENLIASDPGGRNIFGLMIADQLRLAAQSLRWAKRVVIVSGFYIPEAGASETDGPPGAKALGAALEQLDIEVVYVTDRWNEAVFRSLGLSAHIWSGEVPASESATALLDRVRPSHLVSIERVGRGADGRYRNMRGLDITSTTAALDELFIEAGRRGLTTIGVGDGGNEIGMGRVFAEAMSAVAHGARIASTVLTDFCIAAGVSNWGAYGLAGALSVLEERDLLPSAREAIADVARAVADGGAVDGVSHRREATVDSLDAAMTVRMLEGIRRHIAPSPFTLGRSLTVGLLGYGVTGRAAARLLSRRGHRVCISDEGQVTIEGSTVIAGVETGRHTFDFLSRCDLVVVSPGVRRDHPIIDLLHQHGIPVMSELEMAYQLGELPLLAVTGTIGKRATVELLRDLFERCGRTIAIGGNRGAPLSELIVAREDASVASDAQRDRAEADPVAVAVSSFQLETVVHFRPHIAVILNVDEAHLDRHRSVAEYVRIKSRVFMNQRPDDSLVLNLDDSRVRPLARKHRGRTFFVSVMQPVDRGAWLLGDEIHVNLDGAVENLGVVRSQQPISLLSSAIVARLCGIESDRLREALARWGAA